jgi:osmoprotectant transport system ATP-binding protein
LRVENYPTANHRIIFSRSDKWQYKQAIQGCKIRGCKAIKVCAGFPSHFMSEQANIESAIGNRQSAIGSSAIGNRQSDDEEIVVAFQNVGLRIHDKTLVEDLNFAVKRGETLVLLGRSGSGKTTTLKLINRLLEPTDGEVLVERQTTTAWNAIKLRRRIGYVIQETGLFPHFTVERNIALVPNLEGWTQERINERVRQLLELVGLDPKVFSSRFPQQLSGGQRQRVGVARALAADPPIILMDEPFGALDPLTRAELQSEFAALAKRLHKTIVFVTHDIREAFKLASRIGLFKDGRLVELCEPADFLHSTHAEAIAFLETMHDE